MGLSSPGTITFFLMFVLFLTTNFGITELLLTWHFLAQMSLDRQQNIAQAHTTAQCNDKGINRRQIEKEALMNKEQTVMQQRCPYHIIYHPLCQSAFPVGYIETLIKTGFVVTLLFI